MTRPDLAAKAREIADAAIEAGYRECMERQFTCAIDGDAAAVSGWARETLAKHVTEAVASALTEADAAATERAAKVVEAIATTLRPMTPKALLAEHLAAAIRNQEKPDADA